MRTCSQPLIVEHWGLVPVCHTDKNKKPLYAAYIFGGRTGTRTLDPLIKSQLLYQLSYAPGSCYLACMPYH